MSNISQNDYSSFGVERTPYVYIPVSVPIPSGDKSSIEQSEAMAALFIPPANFPYLTPPHNETNLALIVSSIDGSGKPIVALLFSMANQMQKMVIEVADKWGQNIREIEDWVQRQIQSPNYQYLLEIKIHGDPNQGLVSGAQSVSSANAAAANPASANARPTDFLDSVTRLEILERLPPTANIPEADNDPNATVVIIPLTASFMIGGVLAFGTVDMQTTLGGMSTQPFNAPVEFVEKMQSINPFLAAQDIIPIINLMVAAPIYFNSFSEAVSNGSDNERKTYIGTAQNFARDAIRMCTDPTFVLATFVPQIAGSEQLDPKQQQQLAVWLKVILATTALSLLYSTDVGKVQSGKFWGMEPQELRDLLNGTIAVPDIAQAKTTQERLTAQLLSIVRTNLADLDPADRSTVVGAVLDYLAEGHDVDHMLDPARVFTGVFSSIGTGLDTQPI